MAIQRRSRQDKQQSRLNKSSVMYSFQADSRPVRAIGKTEAVVSASSSSPKLSNTDFTNTPLFRYDPALIMAQLQKTGVVIIILIVLLLISTWWIKTHS